ncbi:hypothetical protein M885DRAFT_547104 [Pelagophyceae sp. CCMP2097]|nr:hypothetical protein M885DRAFT_547104 [Pelagophyceae sp. CCMP2097]
MKGALLLSLLSSAAAFAPPARGAARAATFLRSEKDFDAPLESRIAAGNAAKAGSAQGKTPDELDDECILTPGAANCVDFDAPLDRQLVVDNVVIKETDFDAPLESRLAAGNVDPASATGKTPDEIDDECILTPGAANCVDFDAPDDRRVAGDKK